MSKTFTQTSTSPMGLNPSNDGSSGIIDPVRIIGVDPGLASTGWGIVEVIHGHLRYVAHGCIETSAENLRGERLHKIHKTFLAVLRKYKPTAAAMENLYFGKNISSAMSVAEARGVLLLALTAQGLSVRELTPNAIKQAVTGVSKADKSQIQEMVRLILGLKETPKPDHAADALGAAICAVQKGSLSFSKAGQLGPQAGFSPAGRK